MSKQANYKQPSSQAEPGLENQAQQLPAASLGRLLAALIYDGLLLLAVLFLATILFIIPQQFSNPVDTTAAASLSATHYTGPYYYSYIVIITYFFFAWFWTHGGQTLGLKAWSLRVQNLQGASISWWQSLFRLMSAAAPWIATIFAYSQLNKLQLIPAPEIYAVFLVGFSGVLWMIFDQQHRSLQDIFSDTRVVYIKSPDKSSRK